MSSEKESVRKSRRQEGLEAEQPPPPSSAPPGSRLRTLLAVDSERGRACYSAPPERAWRLDGNAPFDPSQLLSDGIETYECIEIEAERQEPIMEDDDEESVRSDEESDDEDEEEESEDDDEYEGMPTLLRTLPSFDTFDDQYTKLIPFLELKGLVENSCKCKYCGAPVVLKQKTWGLGM